MHCPVCERFSRQNPEDIKAKVVKTQTLRQTTQRIYRCPHPECGTTFHTVEIPRTRFRELEGIERTAKDFARRVRT